MSDLLLNNLATIVVFTAALPALLFTVVYGIGSPWYKSLLGVVMFVLVLSIDLTLAQVITHRVFGNYPGFGVFGVLAYSLVVVALWGLFIMLLIERRRPHPREEIPNPLTPKGKK